MDTPKGIPRGWKLLKSRPKYNTPSLIMVVLCEREPLNEYSMNWVTWNFDSDPNHTKDYESTCTSGNYFSSLERAENDFNTR